MEDRRVRVTVEVLDPAEASRAWPALRERFLVAASEHPAEFEQDVDAQLGAVYRGDKFVIHVVDLDSMQAVAVGLLECCELRDGRTLHVRYLAGDGMGEWLDALLEELERIADVEQCAFLSLQGRPGWMRELRCRGWTPAAVYLRRRL
jgi:hypothetical protein